MSNIIEVDFKKQENTNSTLVFSKANISSDARTYAYYIFNVIDNLNSHFWNNYKNANSKLSPLEVNAFEEFIRDSKLQIGDILEFLYATDDNDGAYALLKVEEEIHFKHLLDWLDSIGIPYKQSKIIDIENFIGLKK